MVSVNSKQNEIKSNNIKSLQFNLSTKIFFNTTLDKNTLKDLVFWYLTKYGEKPTINFLELLKTVGFYQATQAGISLGIEDLNIPPEKPFLITKAHLATQKIDQKIVSGSLTSVEKSQCLIDTWNQTSDTLRQTAIQNFKRTNILNPVYMMAFSGARGNVSQVRQLVGMRGLMADPQGAILEFPIQSNFREGLTITEYLISCYGARKGLVDTALRTATSGYLTRRLVDSAQQAVISMHDCGTKLGKILEGKNFRQKLVGRVLAQSIFNIIEKKFDQNSIISNSDAKLISKKYTQILVRSPLTCEASTSVCQMCYGWNLASGKLVQIGEAVGVIAAQSIGEPGTQLTMRTFHTGGVGVFSNQTLKPIYAPFTGKIIFNNSLPGHFIRTPYGKIVYMVKPIPTEQNRVICRLESLSKKHRSFVIREQDITPGSLLFVKHNEIVEAKQLLLQISYLKITKQKLPESSHPVYSPLEGQVFFESMKLIVEKENHPNLEKNFFHSNSPGVRRMKKIGSFWVLAASNQHEIHALPPFMEPNDLVSKKTILFNYDFYSSTKTQLQKIDSKLVFGLHNLQIPSKNLYYHNGNYLINNNSGIFVYYKESNAESLINWYPLQTSNFLGDQKFQNHYIYPLYTNLFKKEYNQVHENFDQLLFKQKIGTVFSTNINLTSHFRQLRFLYSKNLTKKFFPNFVLRNDLKLISSHFANTMINFDSKNNSYFKNRGQILFSLGWVSFMSPTAKSSSVTLQMKNIVQINFTSTGSVINGFLFPKKNITFKKFKNVFSKNLKITPKLFYARNWYKLNDLIPSNIVQTKSNINSNLSFTNFKFRYGLIWYSQDFSGQINKLTVNNRNYTDIVNIALIQDLKETKIENKKYYTKILSKIYGKNFIQNPLSPLFSKQKSTLLKRKEKHRINFTFRSNILRSKWKNLNYFCLETFLQSKFVGIKTPYSPQIYFNFQNLLNNNKCGLSVFQYHVSNFTNPNLFAFRISPQKWISHLKPFSRGTLKIKYGGEFLFKVQKNTGTYNSIIQTKHLLTVESKNPNSFEVGNLIRWGEEFELGKCITYTGQIIKKSPTNMTLRLGRPFLASAHGIVHIFQNDLVSKNDLLITLKSRQLQTEDIVQGIPKIEQLFEARESQSGEILAETVHTKLKNAFLRELKLLENNHWSHAVQKSFLEAQEFLVEKIVEAYENQGVKISEKHVEVIVRQMTNRVRILEAGDTGLLPGELVQHSWIQKFNRNMRAIGLREAMYQPLVLGISKSVLQSESFLLAASFQEVSRVLVRSALCKKRDFLHGLHENVIVGQLIPAGTGLISHLNAQNLSIK